MGYITYPLSLGQRCDYVSFTTQEVVLHRLLAEADRHEAAVPAAAAAASGHAADGRRPPLPGADLVLPSSAVLEDLDGRRGFSTPSRYYYGTVRFGEYDKYIRCTKNRI